MNNEININISRYCLQCGKIIERKNLKFSEYSKRKFCNNSCSASYCNKLKKKKPKKNAIIVARNLIIGKRNIVTTNVNKNMSIKNILKNGKMVL